jgi:hypothetical protein
MTGCENDPEYGESRTFIIGFSFLQSGINCIFSDYDSLCDYRGPADDE